MSDNEIITIQVTPDYLFFTAGQAAEKIGFSIISALPLRKKLACQLRYLKEPSCIKDGMLQVLSNLPIVGLPFSVLQFVSGYMPNLDGDDGGGKSSEENLIRILAVPVTVASLSGIVMGVEKYDIRINGIKMLPPSLQRVILALSRFNPNIISDDVGKASLEYATKNIREALSDRTVTQSAGSIYGGYRAEISLALSYLDGGQPDQAFYYISKACKTMYNQFSVVEMVTICEYFLSTYSEYNSSKLPLIQLYVKALIQLGDTEEALTQSWVIVKSSADEVMRYEAMVNVVFCMEAKNDCDEAIETGERWLTEITDPYWVASMKRALAWTLVHLGSKDSLLKAIKLSTEAEEIFSEYDNSDALFRRGRVFNTVGAAYELLFDYAEDAATASKYLQESKLAHSRSIKIMRELKEPGNESSSMLNSSIVMRKMKKYNKAVNLAVEAVKVKEGICDMYNLPPATYNLAFARVCQFLFTKSLPGSNPKQLEVAIREIKSALEHREEQNSHKSVTGLLSIMVICEMLVDKTVKDSEAISQLMELSDPANELDKLPIFHKAKSCVYLRIGEPIPDNIDKANMEKELPSAEKILGLV